MVRNSQSLVCGCRERIPGGRSLVEWEGGAGHCDCAPSSDAPPDPQAAPSPGLPPAPPQLRRLSSALRAPRPRPPPQGPHRLPGPPPTPEPSRGPRRRTKARAQPRSSPGSPRPRRPRHRRGRGRREGRGRQGGAAGGGAAQRPQWVAVAPAAPPADWPGAGAEPLVQTTGGAWSPSSRAAALAVGPAPSAAPPPAAPRSPRAAPVRLRWPPEGGASRAGEE